MLQSETDYARLSRSLGVNVHSIDARNVCIIRSNKLGHLNIRGKIVDTTDALKPILRDFMSFNRNLSREQSIERIQDKTYEGYNYPFFSIISDSELNSQIRTITQQLDTVQNSERLRKNLIWVRALWIQKKHFLHAIQRENLKEIQSQAHFRIEPQVRDQEHVNELLVPILEVISELRNVEAEARFGESFDAISKRSNFLLNDHFKLRYLENQYPLFILVNPERISNGFGPPPEKVVTKPLPEQD